MTDNPKIRSIWDDDFEDPANAIYFMCAHLDHIGKITDHYDLMEIANYIQRHLDVLSPPCEDDKDI